MAPAATPDDQAATADFNLIGSAGISGHRTVPKGIPIYAPGEQPQRSGFIGLEGSVMDDHFQIDEGLFEMPSMANEQDRAFLQSNDFTRAIDSWLNFDAMH